MTANRHTSVVFIHGLWLHSTSWAPWMELFEEAGYHTVAPGWPGEPDTVEAARAQPDRVANHGVDDVTKHYAALIDAMETSPILVGHSFGGTIAQKLLGQNRAAAAVAIDAAQIKGVLALPLSALRAAFPAFKNPANRRRSVSLTAEQFRYAFGNTLSMAESNQLHEQWTIPSPARPLFEAATANFQPNSPVKVDTGNRERGPLLLTMGGHDNTVPEAVTKSTLKQYRHSTAVTDLTEFPDRGHSLTIDSGWRDVADACLAWLDRQGLAAPRS